MVIRRGSVSVLAVGVMLLGLFAFGQSRAEARNFSTASSFGFYSGNPDAFLGQVATNNNSCRAGRLVKVFRERGRRDTLIGRDRASGTGQWIVEGNVPAARYYALIPRKTIDGGRNVCRRYKTSTLYFD